MFVLLEHTTSAGVHWDLMIEQPGEATLLTWRLLADPVAADAVPAESIDRHRRAYLDYEGDIGGGRGSVRRIDRGPATIVSSDRDGSIVNLQGERLRGEFTFTRESSVLLFGRTRPPDP